MGDGTASAKLRATPFDGMWTAQQGLSGRVYCTGGLSSGSRVLAGTVFVVDRELYP